MTLRKTVNTAAAALCLMTANASATEILFEDTFNRANSRTVGNGWTELQDERNDVAISNGNLRLRDNVFGLPDAAAATRTIDAIGYDNIEVSFRWRALHPNEAHDRLYLSYADSPAPSLSNQNAWTLAFGRGSGGTSTFAEQVSLADATNSIFNIMLWTDVSWYNEGFLIRDIRVTGDRIAVTPLPAAIPLLLAGLATLGFLGRRKTQN